MDSLILPWLSHIKTLLHGACNISEHVASGESVLVQEGSDNDSVVQILSLAQILLDPYYRTIEGIFYTHPRKTSNSKKKGFAVLVEKDWIAFGFPFARRMGQFFDKKKNTDEISPIFLQFLDSVWQIWRKFPTRFEFNEQFLTFIARHYYSSRFGTFIDNNEKERRAAVKTKTISIWTQVTVERKRFSNVYYEKEENPLPLKPDLEVVLRKSYYLFWNQQLSVYRQKVSIQVKARARTSSLSRVALDISGIFLEFSLEFSFVIFFNNNNIIFFYL